LWMERGLSRNTLEAYRSDLSRYARWLGSRGRAIPGAEPADVLQYLADHGGRSLRTAARRLSSLRRLYQYLVREGRVPADPTALVEAPRTGRPLPRSLTE